MRGHHHCSAHGRSLRASRVERVNKAWLMRQKMSLASGEQLQQVLKPTLCNEVGCLAPDASTVPPNLRKPAFAT
jgi:hypothetical protein